MPARPSWKFFPRPGRRALAVAGPALLVALLGLSQLDGSGPDRPAPPPTPVTAGGQAALPEGPPPGPPPEAPSTTTAPSSSTTTAAVPPTTAPTQPPAVPPTSGPSTGTFTAPDGYESSVQEIDAATAARMSASWRPGCPVPLRDLRLVTITHRGFDGAAHRGELVVHAAHAEKIRRVFAELFAAGFPIEQVRLVDEFGADDDRSMAANNTSAFNCRYVQGTRRWSQHAFGRAIDINPLRNPYVTRRGVFPPGGREYLRRDGGQPGVITAGSPVVAAFTRIGWSWGGRWASPDYQHFSATGS